MEEVLARIFQFSIAIIGAFVVALWFALVIWTYRDVVSRSRSALMQVFATLIVVLFFIPGVVIYLLLRPNETLDEKQQRWIEEEYLAQELEDVAVCPSCNHSVREEWIFCPSCRYQLRRPCFSCGRLVESAWDVCAFCGVTLRDASDQHSAFADHETTVHASTAMSGPRALPPDSAERHTTADGGAVMTDADGTNQNGTASDEDTSMSETGELPEPVDMQALESGARKRSK